MGLRTFLFTPPMRADDSTDATDASWALLEHTIEQLHAAARSGADQRDFYRQLLSKAAEALGAAGGAAWRAAVRSDELPELICEFEGMGRKDSELDFAARRALATRALVSRQPILDGTLLLAPVVESAATSQDRPPRAAACLELWMPAASGPAVRQGWLDFTAALADVAADFHAFDELRRLRDGATLERGAVDLLRRLERQRGLAETAYEIANEGRRLLECDRLSVVVRRGQKLKLAAVSGVDSVDSRADFARRIAILAEQTASWGEPLIYGGDEQGELPPQLAATLEQYIDQSHARQMACAPIALADSDKKFGAVLVVERFHDAATPTRLREQAMEFGELCAPALQRATELDRFPMSLVMGASRRAAALFAPAQSMRTLLWSAAIAAAIALLVFVKLELNVEAPATLHARIEREIFAPATGSVAEVKVKHGQLVKAGDVLAELRDPELALKRQQVRGQIDSLRNRRASLAVTRTDRNYREDAAAEDRLPLSAEQRQIEEQLASLEAEQKLLDGRLADLTVRSPIAGEVLTRDVESLLSSRPVERGQILMTIADPTGGWELDAEAPQRQMGHVLAAQETAKEPLAVSYRLSADVAADYDGRVVEIAAAAPLDAEGLRDEAAPVHIRIAAEGPTPAAARPGMTATVRIHCGQRAAGYVWLHDAAATVYRLLTF